MVLKMSSFSANPIAHYITINCYYTGPRQLGQDGLKKFMSLWPLPPRNHQCLFRPLLPFAKVGLRLNFGPMLVLSLQIFLVHAISLQREITLVLLTSLPNASQERSGNHLAISHIKHKVTSLQL